MTKVTEPGSRARTQNQGWCDSRSRFINCEPRLIVSEKHPHLPSWLSPILTIPLKGSGDQGGRIVVVNVSLALEETSISCQGQSVFAEFVKWQGNSFLFRQKSSPDQQSH